MARKQRVLAVCSGGGHWIQMRRLRDAFDGCDVTYATVFPANLEGMESERVVSIPDANRETKLMLCFLIARLVWLVVRTRPDAIVSTGAACGFLAIRIGNLLGARTLFLDSIANAEELSMSARLAVPHADQTLSQWEGVAKAKGVGFWGAVV